MTSPGWFVGQDRLQIEHDIISHKHGRKTAENQPFLHIVFTVEKWRFSAVFRPFLL